MFNSNPFRLIYASMILLCSFKTMALPSGFVYLSLVDLSIIQDMRYAGSHNFTGKIVPGYKNPVCILTKKAALALKQVQNELSKKGYSLKVYDCYRPQKAVDAFYRWSLNNDESTKAHWYPREDKKQLFKRGYIARKSGHSRGSTVDLTIVKKNSATKTHQATTQCYGTGIDYLNDDSIDMGTRWDCLDIRAHIHAKGLSHAQRANRALLQNAMKKAGFSPYDKEWWHFTLKEEPYPDEYFNFDVQ